MARRTLIPILSTRDFRYGCRDRDITLHGLNSWEYFWTVFQFDVPRVIAASFPQKGLAPYDWDSQATRLHMNGKLPCLKG